MTEKLRTSGALSSGGPRSLVIDLAKGIAIILVVTAHYSPGDSPRWWLRLNDLISQVDVRVFFFVAGYTWHMRPGERYLDYLGRKARRLLLPYLAVAALFLGIKLIPSLLMDLGNPVTRASVVNILIDPLHSYVPLLWFLYSLFCLEAVAPALDRLGPRTFPVLIAATILFGVSPSLFSLGPTWGNLPFFLIGVYVARVLHVHLDRYTPGRTLPGIAICAALFLGLWAWWTPGAARAARCRDVLVGAAGIATVILVCQALAGTGSRRLAMLAFIGTSSLMIYLLHTLFESSLRIAFYRLPPLNDLPFVVKAVPSIAAGVCFPLVVQNLMARLRLSELRWRAGGVVSRES